MTDLTYHPLPTDLVQAWRSGAPDAYGAAPERLISDGAGNPCRHCLGFVPQGAAMLVLAARPFSHPQPYAETGPIFLCAAECPAWHGLAPPPILQGSPDYLLKGYTAAERIRYGTGRVVAADQITSYANELLARPDIAFVDVRSARNACFQLRITRRGEPALPGGHAR